MVRRRGITPRLLFLWWDEGGEGPFWTAFLNGSVLAVAGTLGDPVILDWLIVSTITPRFVMIPGTEKADYQGYSHHFKAPARASIPLLLMCIVSAAIFRRF